MKKEYKEKDLMGSRGQPKKRTKTEITLEMTDKYPDLRVILALHDFFGVEAGVKRANCQIKPAVRYTDNNVCVLLHWDPPYQLTRVDEIHFICEDPKINKLVYDTAVTEVDQWFNNYKDLEEFISETQKTRN